MLQTIAAEVDVDVARWAFYGTAVVAVASLLSAGIAGYFSWKAKRNTEANGGSSPHDALLTAVEAVAQTQRQTGLVLEQISDEQSRLRGRVDEQAAMTDRILHSLDRIGCRVHERPDQAGG